MCAGWVGCHGYELLALRLAFLAGRIDAATFEAAAGYQSPVELFTSGAQAADHGQAELQEPGVKARAAVEKISRRRSDLRF
ncbi:Uncharacterised protein [Mycobacteroides abscessus subsp. abscessus]|nr:Uncharacterised protein [Mycobacteroides abscessus subsp. abscessus]